MLRYSLGDIIRSAHLSITHIIYHLSASQLNLAILSESIYISTNHSIETISKTLLEHSVECVALGMVNSIQGTVSMEHII